MKQIIKYFTTLQQAERMLNRLYNQYDHVRLVQSPMFSERGTYIYEVR